MADLQNFQTPAMQKLHKKTLNITSNMRNNASLQLCAPGNDKTGNLSTLVMPTDSCALLMALSKHSFTWNKHALSLLLPIGVCDTHILNCLHETFGFQRQAVFGPRVDFGSGLFLSLRPKALVTVDWIACVEPRSFEWQSLFLLSWVLPVIISLQSKEMWTRRPFAKGASQCCRSVGPVEHVVGNQDRDGRMGLQFVETGSTLHVRECGTFDWTPAPCTLHQFELRHGAQHDTYVFYRCCFSRNAVLFADLGVTPCSGLFLSTWKITWFLLTNALPCWPGPLHAGLFFFEAVITDYLTVAAEGHLERITKNLDYGKEFTVTVAGFSWAMRSGTSE